MEFLTYMAALGRTPFTEAVSTAYSAIFEGITPGNLELMKYFRGLDINGNEDDRPCTFKDEDTFYNPRYHFDRWIVHNSEFADRIYEEGFKYGMHIGKLAHSYGSYSNPEEKWSGNVAFGTPLEDAYGLEEEYEVPTIRGSGWLDSGGSIVCKVSGVTAYHRDDMDDQVMFDIKSPEGCFWIRNTGFRSRFTGNVAERDNDPEDHGVEDSYEVIGKNPNRPLCRGTYDRCIQWCLDNGDAYAHMMKRWK